MDFASGLASLEKSAANEQNRRRHRDNNSNRNSDSQGGDDQRRYQPRSRRDYYQSGPNQYQRERSNSDDRYRNNFYGHGSGRSRQHGYQNRSNHHNSNNSYGYNQDHALDGLARYGYRIPRGIYHRPPPIAGAATSSRPLHICLLAITIEDMPYESIWKHWASATSAKSCHKVSLVCHAKFPDRVKSAFLKQRMLLKDRRVVRGNKLSDPEFKSHSPTWGSVEITRAMIDLLDTAMEMGRKGEKKEEDPRFSANRFLITNPPQSSEELACQDVPPADKFLFISETCLPVTTLDESMQALFPTVTLADLVTLKDKKEECPSETGKEAAKDFAAEDNAETKEVTTSEEHSKTGNEDCSTGQENESLTYLDSSWVNARNFNSPNTPQNMYEKDQFQNIGRVVPKRFRWKADQWVALSRAHAAAVLDIDRAARKQGRDQLWNSCFRRINASDEMYFPTTLALAGILVDTSKSHQHQQAPKEDLGREHEQREQQHQQTGDTSTPWLERRRLTYTDWSQGARNPALFTNGSKDFANVARLARRQGCLLARKFAPFQEIPGQDMSLVARTGDMTVDEWQLKMTAIRQAEDKANEERAANKEEVASN